VSEYLENKQGKGLSRRHLQDLKNRLGKFASFAGEKTASEIKPEQIEHWLQQFGGENHNNYLQRLHGLFNYGIKRGYLAENPTKVIDKVKVAQTEPAIFATELVEALLNAVPRRAVPYFAIGAFAGLRPREIERLDWADIQLGRRLHPSAPQGSKDCEQPPRRHPTQPTSVASTTDPGKWPCDDTQYPQNQRSCPMQDRLNPMASRWTPPQLRQLPPRPLQKHK
jgi:site-specific recombinase XerC